MDHPTQRVRFELKSRRVVVQSTERLTPHMQRIVFSGQDLADFASLSPDDHVKLFFPGNGRRDGGHHDGAPVERRDYTPRRYDAKAQSLTIDFALHDAGPATHWALQAKAGDTLDFGGPRGSMVVEWTYDWWLLIGDETALPAIGRRVEEAPAGTRIITIGIVPGPEDEQRFDTRAQHTALWVHRSPDHADDAGPVLQALKSLALPQGEGYVWAAAEAGVAKVIRTYLREEIDHPRAATKVVGYWKKGHADAHEKFED
ncbi:siderophore-interacting protein [Bordetella sp. LUAb4]|uniref:siderophore-interacting protein n=1 Tax=Bordetella sp. LUAb4 TaxID=2843195 RepID=UPI001E40EC3B